MTGALASIEARHLARSPLLWLGILLGAASVAPALWSIWPVLAASAMASTALSATSAGTATSILILGRKLTAYSAPR